MSLSYYPNITEVNFSLIHGNSHGEAISTDLSIVLAGMDQVGDP